MTLDEWIAEHGLQHLVEQWKTHFQVYGHSEEEAFHLVRLCMISLRDFLT